MHSIRQLYRRTKSSDAEPRSAQETPEMDGLPTPPHVDTAEVDALNGDLERVVAVFPEVRPEVFRELLMSFSGESRIYLVTEALLMNKPKVVRGRWRVSQDRDGEAQGHQPQPEEVSLPLSERFRNDAYKTAVKAAFYDEFKSLSHSAIRAVLAEHNYSYTGARPVLLELNSASWSSTFFSWLSRRRAPSVSNHPLIAWELPQSSVGPSVKPVANRELEEELHSTLVAPVRNKRLQEQLENDADIAEELNYAEAEAENAALDCECCFTSSAFERIAVCSDKGHYLCYRCLRHTMSEAIYGQGWAQSVDVDRCTLKCVAAGSDGCMGAISQNLLQTAIGSNKSGPETWQRFEDKLINDSLSRSGLQVLKCPFCPYAESRPLRRTTSKDVLQSAMNSPVLAFIGMASVLILASTVIRVLESFWLFRQAADYLAPLALPVMFAVLVLLGPRSLATTTTDPAVAVRGPTILRRIMKAMNKIATRMRLKKHKLINSTMTEQDTSPSNDKGRKFICRSPRCGARSCLTCRTRWADPHACYSVQSTSLRTHVEAALTAATKRTCPLCGLSFVKSDGCNKLACPCGYKMCYLCRADVRRAGYAHFCPHFRASGAGACPEACGRCDLYKDEGVALDDVKRAAEADWWARQDRRSLDGRREILGGALDGLGAADGPGGRARRRWALF